MLSAEFPGPSRRRDYGPQGGIILTNSDEHAVTSGADDGQVLQSADSGAAGFRPVPATSVAQDNSRLDDLLGRTGTMHLVYWLIDLLEGFVPLISLGMEG